MHEAVLSRNGKVLVRVLVWQRMLMLVLMLMQVRERVLMLVLVRMQVRVCGWMRVCMRMWMRVLGHGPVPRRSCGLPGSIVRCHGRLGHAAAPLEWRRARRSVSPCHRISGA